VHLLLQETTGIVEHVLQQVRAMSLNLRPSVLDDLGLVSALRWMLHTQGQRAGVQTRFVADPPEMHLPPHIEITCFRVVQEAVTNVIRHAHATSISVEVYQRSAEVAVCIRDDGRGFDVDAAYERARQGKSLGVLGMQERVSLIGGALEIDSVPHHGSTIQVLIPLASNEGLTNEVGASRGSP
jgi:signal transduction histidine kinase